MPTLRTILIRDWQAMPEHAAPNTEHGHQRIDIEDGSIWEWVKGGKRIKAKRVPRKLPNANIHQGARP